MKYKCPLCKIILKRDGRTSKGKSIKSYCLKFGKTTILRVIKDERKNTRSVK